MLPPFPSQLDTRAIALALPGFILERVTGTTRYFDEQVLRKRPYLTVALCRSVLANPLRREVQADDGRIRHWGRVTLPGEGEERILRVVTLGDGATIHNAFIDRGFRETTP